MAGKHTEQEYALVKGSYVNCDSTLPWKVSLAPICGCLLLNPQP